MKTIKIIELLNKVANGETPPEKIKYLDTIFRYDYDVDDYISELFCRDCLLDKIAVVEYSLNNKIEIIEEEIIEDTEDNKKIKKIGKGHYIDDEEVLEKIDEIIDYINNNHIPRID